MLDERLANAEALSRFYASQLEKGSTNIIETNKIDLELLNARNEARQNEAARQAKLEELTALNGGVPVAFADTVYRSAWEYPSDFEAFRVESFPGRSLGFAARNAGVAKRSGSGIAFGDGQQATMVAQLDIRISNESFEWWRPL